MSERASSPCTCFLLRRAARQVSQVYDHALAGAGLGVNQYSLLRHARAPLALGELAARLGMDRTTLNRNLQPLLRDGLVEDARGEDPRQRLVRLTDAGRARLAQARPLWRKAQQRVDALLGERGRDRLHASLDALHAALAQERQA
ncbi:MarR family winged helix-turn-helix transcriptional regulator [Pseudoxanthomonas sp. J35]|uniref:MarR family winged helix-turn-helix transcriptional regulator n=1 Tax=Pseudoxanthomonas sp. J35 TaxID=935852 RepID=UPI0004910753|nr:MarR family winged helix-turn-helix transcriptional regulator [Pseudoxanthomonas sp. J35]